VISQGAITTLKEIRDWYVKKYYTYIKVYGSTELPHLLPKYVPDKLLAKEIAYQMVEKGITTYISEKNKKYSLIFPLHVGRYSLLNKPYAEKEVESLREICFCIGSLKGHNPHNIVQDHLKSVKLAQQVGHEVNFACWTVGCH
jgi:hypothetical protein